MQADCMHCSEGGRMPAIASSLDSSRWQTTSSSKRFEARSVFCFVPEDDTTCKGRVNMQPTGARDTGTGRPDRGEEDGVVIESHPSSISLP